MKEHKCKKMKYTEDRIEYDDEKGSWEHWECHEYTMDDGWGSWQMSDYNIHDIDECPFCGEILR